MNYYRKGWSDRANNRPIDYTKYDRLDAEQQLAYEHGRRDAACAQSGKVKRKTPPANTLVLPLRVQLMMAIERFFKPNRKAP